MRKIQIKQPLKCGCTWSIHFRHKKRIHKDDTNKDKQPIVITSVSPEHPFPCQPGVRQFTFVNTRGRKYSKEKSLILHQLVSHMALQNNHFASAIYIRSLMLKVFPCRKHISGADIYNLRIRAKLLMKKKI